MVLFGISPAFAGLSQTRGQITHVLLTRAPLYNTYCYVLLVRLACVKHAASVRSEPGSNSPKKSDPYAMLLKVTGLFITQKPANPKSLARLRIYAPI